MISIGNFFFKYRNNLFIFLYLLLFLPSPQDLHAGSFRAVLLFVSADLRADCYFLGEIIRGITIGLAYIIRGGRDKKVYAEKLVTEGIFRHCRNPLYVGNILMLLGVGILSNSAIYVGIVMPLFLFIYQAIVLAEENFLRNKFGTDFDQYCSRVNRWLFNPFGLGKTFEGMQFNYTRWLLKEYNTLLVWLLGIAAILIFKYPQFIPETNNRIMVFAVVTLLLGALYGYIRYLKKSGKMTDAMA